MAATAMAPHITRLRLTAFRCHAALDLTCGNGAVVLTGANGLGKTNILEAISMLAPGRGLRSVALDAMLQVSAAPGSGWTVTADLDGPLGAVRAGVAYAPPISPMTGSGHGQENGRETARGGSRKVRIDGTNRKVEELTPVVPQLWLT
ncbi:MAG: AAA family ATPase, partial [Parvibaculales bacterium]